MFYYLSKLHVESKFGLISKNIAKVWHFTLIKVISKDSEQ